MKKLLLLLLVTFSTQFIHAQSKEQLTVSFNGISSIGEVTDENFFRNDELIVGSNPGSSVSVQEFKIGGVKPETAISVQGNKLSEEAKSLVKSFLTHNEKTVVISGIKLINKNTGKITEYSKTITLKIVYN